MRLLTKAEACRELRLSLSTLNRRIAAGEVAVRREPRGRRHRVYVMMDGDPPWNGVAADPALARWPGSGFAVWRGRWSCCKSSLTRSGSATPSWSTG